MRTFGANIDAALEEAAMRLEQLRNELSDEIKRVQRERNEREEAARRKILDIEVEG